MKCSISFLSRFLSFFGQGGKSIYGGHFDDESFHIKFHGPGWLGQANAGPNTNADQFFITTADTSFLNDGYVVTGKVVKGMVRSLLWYFLV